jgi:regulator of protease activity HflC (stomatin/prohibitin superfamily)
MFSELWDIVKQVYTDLNPIAKIDAWERGVFLRFGKFSRERGPGWWWKFPLIETCINTTVVTTTATLPPQSLNTKDCLNVVVEAVVRYAIGDVRKFILDVYDRQDAINDTTMGIIAKTISSKTWEECATGQAELEISKKTKAGLRRWGVTVEEVTLTTLTQMRSIRLIGVSPNNTIQQ